MATSIGRRQFISVLGGAMFAWPLTARAQKLGGTTRIGLLRTAAPDDPVSGPGYPAFLDELKKSGSSAGQNLTIEIVRTDQDAKRLLAETANLVRSKVDLLVRLAPRLRCRRPWPDPHSSNRHVGHQL